MSDMRDMSEKTIEERVSDLIDTFPVDGSDGEKLSAACFFIADWMEEDEEKE
jgi:hypothetical protein